MCELAVVQNNSFHSGASRQQRESPMSPRFGGQKGGRSSSESRTQYDPVALCVWTEKIKKRKQTVIHQIQHKQLIHITFSVSIVPLEFHSSQRNRNGSSSASDACRLSMLDLERATVRPHRSDTFWCKARRLLAYQILIVLKLSSKRKKNEMKFSFSRQ